jgi:acyl-CoA dehydrogenase
VIVSDLVNIARLVSADVAAVWSAEVDRDARFPAEAVAEMRRNGLLGALVPPEWGGSGASIAAMGQAVTAISANCASSALVLAMHQIQVACLIRHGSPALKDTVLPRIASGQLLLANANSEIGLGGNRRSSLCGLVPTEDGYHLDKQGSTISYGEYADGVLATARRSVDSQDNDQVLVVCLEPDYQIEPMGDWDTLGLRGTCSRPGHLVADVASDFVIPDYGTVFVRTSLPVSVVLLSSVWLGIAEGAARKAHDYLRGQARKHRAASTPSGPPLGTLRLAELAVVLQQMRDGISAGAAEYERLNDGTEIETLRFSGRMDNIKLAISTQVLDVVVRALAITGITGYTNGSPFSLGRSLRDAAAAPLMVSNDRALWATAQTLLLRKEL